MDLKRYIKDNCKTTDLRFKLDLSLRFKITDLS